MVITWEVHFILYAKLLFSAREIEQLTSQLNALVLVYVSIVSVLHEFKIKPVKFRKQFLILSFAVVVVTNVIGKIGHLCE